MTLLITPADAAFSKCVRERVNWHCERCGKWSPPDKRMGLHCSHFVGRGSWSTRFNPLNAWSHCYGCHAHFEAHPHDFTVWAAERLGRDSLQALVRLGGTPGRKIRQNVKIIAAHYREEHKAQQAERDQGNAGRIDFSICPILPDLDLVTWRKAMGDE